VLASQAQMDELRRSFAGDVITPDAAGYDDARRVWNAMLSLIHKSQPTRQRCIS
jgi:hypothetical protein